MTKLWRLTGFNPLLPVLVVAVGGLLVLSGCGGGGGETGTLRVAMTDAAGPYDKVVLAIKEIRLVPAGSDAAPTGPSLPLLATFSPAEILDVLALAFVQHVLGEAVVPAGNYVQVRLVLEPNPVTGDPVNYVTLASDPTVKHALDTPSGQQSGLKILGQYEVAPGVLNAIALDFDPTRAIVQSGSSGKYILKPTGVRLVQLSEVLPTYGSLSGAVAPPAAWPTAVVAVTPVGSAVPIATGTVNPDDGSFRAFLPAGNYTVRVTADGYAPYNSATLVPPLAYTVALGADTPVGAITLTP